VYWAVNTVWLNSGGAEEIPPSHALFPILLSPLSLSLLLSVFASLSDQVRSFVRFLFLPRCFTPLLSVIAFSFFMRPYTTVQENKTAVPSLFHFHYRGKCRDICLHVNWTSLLVARWFAKFYANFRVMKCVILLSSWFDVKGQLVFAKYPLENSLKPPEEDSKRRSIHSWSVEKLYKLINTFHAIPYASTLILSETKTLRIIAA